MKVKVRIGKISSSYNLCGFIIFQITIMGVFGVLAAPYESISIILPLTVTIIYTIYIHKMNKRL